MFSFFGKLRAEVTQAVSSIHERLITLEARVEALFNHVNTEAAAKVAEVPKAVGAVEIASAQPVTSEPPVTTPTNDGEVH